MAILRKLQEELSLTTEVSRVPNEPSDGALGSCHMHPEKNALFEPLKSRYMPISEGIIYS
jgi:hypothetical protein